MHGIVIIVNVALLSLHGAITLLEMLLWGAAPAPYHLAAEGKAPLIPPPQRSFLWSCAQAELCFARLSLPDLICSFQVIAAHPAHPERGVRACCPSCSAFNSQIPLCCSGWGPNLTCMPLSSRAKGFLPQQVKITPVLKIARGVQAIPASLDFPSITSASPTCQAEFSLLGAYSGENRLNSILIHQGAGTHP